MKKIYSWILLLFFFAPLVQAQGIDSDSIPVLKHWMTPEELLRKGEIGKSFVETDPPAAPVRNVAEFDQMQGALVRYPFGIPLALIKEMSLQLKVTTIVSNTSEKNTVIQQYLSVGIDTSHCNFIIAPTDSYWTRDYGPWFVSDSINHIGIVDFPYNRPRPGDDEIPKKAAAMLGIPWYGMNVIHTGGNYMTDGLGNSASTQLVWEENPTQTHAQISQKMHDYLGIDNYHVVVDPNNTYIDHIDCWAKFLAPDKILVRKVPPSHSRYAAIEAAANYWASQICPYGYPYHVYRVMTGQDQPYTNSVILNNKVLIPFMGSSWDDSAKAAYQAAMPGYTVKGFLGNPNTPWESTDALHCRVMGIADVGQLFIRHLPLYGNQTGMHGYQVVMRLYACSYTPVIDDSVLLHYRVGPGPFVTVKMNHPGGNVYDAYIPRQPEGSLIKYYITAADQSGRHATLPFIGAADPFRFVTIDTLLCTTPDTLRYEDVTDAFSGLQFTIKNTLERNVTLVGLQQEGTGVPWWIDTIPSLPLVMMPGDTLSLLVKVPIPVTSFPATQYFIDSLKIVSSEGIQHEILMINTDILSAVAGRDTRSGSAYNYPNPFTDATSLPVFASRGERILMEIFDMRGRKVRTLLNSSGEGAIQKVTWNGTDDHGDLLPGGIYLCRVTSGEKTITCRMVLIR